MNEDQLARLRALIAEVKDTAKDVPDSMMRMATECGRAYSETQDCDAAVVFIVPCSADADDDEPSSAPATACKGAIYLQRMLVDADGTIDVGVARFDTNLSLEKVRLRASND